MGTWGDSVFPISSTCSVTFDRAQRRTEEEAGFSHGRDTLNITSFLFSNCFVDKLNDNHCRLQQEHSLVQRHLASHLLRLRTDKWDHRLQRWLGSHRSPNLEKGKIWLCNVCPKSHSKEMKKSAEFWLLLWLMYAGHFSTFNFLEIRPF